MATKLSPSPLQGVFFRATLPLPPGFNHSYDIRKMKTKKGKWASSLMSSSEAKAWKEEVAIILSQQMIKNLDKAVFEAIKYSESKRQKVLYTLTMDFYFEYLFKKDEDMGIKATQDAVFNALGINDNRVKRLEVEKFEDREYQRCEITVSLWVGRK